MEPTGRRVLVVNGKGGCGKTTIATNLAAGYARRGHAVALIDHDPQASSAQWHQHRSASLPTVHLLEAHRRTAMYTTRVFQRRLPAGTDRLVVDTPSAVGDIELDTLLRGIDVILVPFLPSSIDMRAGTRFLAQLKNHRLYRARPMPIGAIANRVRQSSLTHSKLVSFLDCLGVPTVASFRDSALYTQMAEDGSSLFDVESDGGIERERRQWDALLDWIDARSLCDAALTQTGSARGPHAATGHPRLNRSIRAH
jgi:chromosome partitioning protein